MYAKRHWISWVISVCMLLFCRSAYAAPLETQVPIDLQTPSVLLMEASTGQVIFEKNANERRPVASITKLMTILLVLEELERGTISLTDDVTSSQRASGMGGSQALLDANETYKLREMLKSMIIASANDSAVALAEHIAGAEEVFVQRMNSRAASLQMENTHYANCTGLPAEGHYTTARDVAIVSREVGKHPLFFEYSHIWMDTIEHKGGRKTDLTNTNRLIRFYEGCDGFKTGSTSEAKYCLSATAMRGGMRMVAVVLGTPASQTRFDEARKMLDYGFANYQLVQVAKAGDLLGMQVAVELGAQAKVEAAMGEDVALLLRKGQERELQIKAFLPENVKAPIQAGDVLGEIQVQWKDEMLTTLPAVAASDVRLPGYLESLLRMLEHWRR